MGKFRQGAMGKKSPHQTDVVVGRNIRIWRLEKKMSQTELANRLGLTFQQVQKYESGANRVGASRLMQISEALDVPIHSFFEGAGGDVAAQTESPMSLVADAQALRLVRAFAGIDRDRHTASGGHDPLDHREDAHNLVIR